jgi:replication factor A1
MWFCRGVAIKARVTNKGPVKTWSNSKGEGKLFNMDLLDDSGEIRMAGFKDQVDAFYDMLKVDCSSRPFKNLLFLFFLFVIVHGMTLILFIFQVGEVYYIKNFTIKPANKQWSTLNNEYELTMTSETQIQPCSDNDAGDVPVVSYNFVDIASIEGCEKDKFIGMINSHSVAY